MNHQKSLFFICFIIICDLYQINAYGVDDNEIGDFDGAVISEYLGYIIVIDEFFDLFWELKRVSHLLNVN